MIDSVDLMICGNCKHYKDGCCSESWDENKYPAANKQVNGSDGCFNGYFEKGEVIKDSTLFDDIIKILKNYLDLKEEYYPLIATWIIGSYLHQNFYTYPYLFLNAMKGSGKSRTLKLVIYLSKQGFLLGSIKEAALFRLKNDCTFGLDEFESISNKDYQALRELLNAAYKKGMLVPRVKEVRKMDENGKSVRDFEVELLEVYRPIVMANIWGMDEVLNDRCITLILEKSTNSSITDMIEMFDLDPVIQDVKVRLIKFSVDKCSVVTLNLYRELLYEWNTFVKNTTLNYTTTLHTQDYTNIHLFNKIKESKINSRQLELSFPLIVIAELFGKEDEIIGILKQIMEEKREDEVFESKDVQLMDFVSRKDTSEENYESISQLTSEYRIFIEATHEKIDWLNNSWMGRALKRLALIKKKRRVGHGMDVLLNIEKAKEKIKIYRPKEKEE